MTESRIQFKSVVKNQLPLYVREEFPLLGEFLSQYYISQEFQGAPVDLIQNIDNYIKLDNNANVISSTTLRSSIEDDDETILVSNTQGFPEEYGLIRIDDEIITYTGKTDISFTGCVRGFSGIADDNKSELVFTTSVAATHDNESTVENLSVLFLQEFLRKIKHQFLPGLENRDLYTEIDQNLFIKQSKDFYNSKGTDESFRILFKALYGENVEIVKPRDNLIAPSQSLYKVTGDLIVEPISGDVSSIEGYTLYQNNYGDIIDKAYAPITNVEKVFVSGASTDYYRLSIDINYARDALYNGAEYGSFSSHPKTKIISEYTTGAETLDVDSTLGFPESGELSVVYSDSTLGVVSYSSKSINQFYGCSGITQTILNNTNVGINTFATCTLSDGSSVSVRILSVLSDINYDQNNYLYEKGDTIEIKTLGEDSKNAVSNSLILNAATSYEATSIVKINSISFRYRVTFENDHIFNIGDSITITTSGYSGTSKVYSVNSSKSITIGDQGSLDSFISNNLTFTLRRNILKANTTNFSSVDNIATNVLNSYTKNNSTLIASPSLPFYKDQPLNVKKNLITFSGTFSGDTFKILPSGDHGFYTGDAVYYTPQKITTTETDIDGNTSQIITTQTGILEEGIYFVKRLSDTTSLKLSRSRTQLYNEEYVTTNPISVIDNTIEFYKFKDQTLESQKILREISSPINDGYPIETSPGTTTGILVNGVEILNYKSIDNIYYGRIESIEVDGGGSQYDVINPPILNISDSTGIGATGSIGVSGSFKEIRVINGGFDYIETPKIKITGGNGSGAIAEAKTKLVSHEVSFNSQENFGLVSLGSSSRIGFSTYHKFRDYEKVIYNPNELTAISGLSTGASYYVSVQDEYTIKLHKTRDDAVSGINTITFSDYGVGKHTFISENKKSVISTINIVNSGSGYSNNKTSVSGISTALNEIHSTSHGYNSRSLVVYTTTGTPIGGLTSGNNYYITKIDNNTFKLSEVGPTGNELSYFNKKEYVNLTNTGSGIHYFNYPEISVEVIGKIGISSVGSETFKASLQPIVRGEIVSVNLHDNGVGYGSSEVLNFYREPLVTIDSGSGIQVTPVVSNGQIVQVIVNNGGSNIYAPPKIDIGGGLGCVITPVIENGKLVSVNVLEGGTGYVQGQTTVTVSYPGSNAVLKTSLQRWTVNQFEKNYKFITDDDGFIDKGLNQNYGLQYFHFYAPRKLRETLYSSDQTGKTLYNNPDLAFDNGIERVSSQHSPIIGWSYDGNPIYGPYGYSKKSGGVITQMISGYKLVTKENRPAISAFPQGFFVEDYEYIRSSNESVLDENNGRFCVTPEFPNGTYAYFATINDQLPDSTGVFVGYKKPVFPYLIGNSFNSRPIEFNFLKSSNQDEYSIENNNWLRNTNYYNLLDDTSSYEYLIRPYKLKETQKSKVRYASPGKIDSVGILTGGTNYKVNDSIIFDNSNTGGFGADIRVSKVGGKQITSISCATTSINNVQVFPSGNSGEYIFYSPFPHNFKNFELISISGLSTTTEKLSGTYNIGVTTSNYVLRTGIGTTGATGIVTYISVYGNLNDNKIRENDILDIENEKVKVLNIDQTSSRLRILREYQGTLGTAHSATTVLYEDPRKFTASIGFKTSFDFNLNRQLYFNPVDSLGLGTNSGVGIGTTITFTNPGAGATQIFIPTQTIYLPNHNLNTGDELIYSSNGGSVIGVSTNGSSSLSLTDDFKVYAAKINDNLIGISTVKVGLGSTGVFSGIGSTTQSLGLLYFTDIGSGNNHSLSTNYNNVITISAYKNTVTVSTAETHGLSNSDNVYVSVNPSISTSINVSYNNYNRRIIIGKKQISASDINTTTNEITILDHKFNPGQKLIYTSSSPSGGLTNQKFYYAVIVNKDTIKLSETYYEAISSFPSIVDITSTSDSTLQPVNPPINAYKNSPIVFDLSDSSLTYTLNSISYPAFKLEFFTDENMTKIFDKSSSSESFEVLRSGTVGVDAQVTLVINSNSPQKIYYTLLPIDNDILPSEKSEVVNDYEVKSNSQILVLNSEYSGKHAISIASTNSFNYFIEKIPEKSSYDSSNSTLNYSTDSLTGIGSISEFRIYNGGRNYSKLPSVVDISSGIGSNAVIELNTTTIGNIKKTKLQDIGFDYSFDRTLKPTAKLPEIIKIDNLAIFDSIGITSFGRGYGSISPTILVFDGKTGEQKDEVDLRFNFGSNQIEIVKNTFGVTNIEPTLLPTRNSNGVGISTITYDSGTKDVTVTLATGFSTANSFPFNIGDEILIENASVGIASTNPNGVVEIVNTGRGFNSENYDYRFFIVSGIDENLGGIGIVTFSLDGYLSSGESPGTFNPQRSSARIIPKKDLPTFNINLKTTDFIVGEEVVSLDDKSILGIVERWDSQNGYLKLQTSKDFVDGHIIEGQSSKTRGTVSSTKNFTATYNIDAKSRVESGWEENIGFLNTDTQVLQDGDYYQKFSYVIKSKVDLDTWDDVVSTLNHTAGFKKFSNLQIESQGENTSEVGLATDVTYLNQVIDLVQDIDMNCVYNFDLVRENNINGNISDEIIFSNRILTDYSESVGNRVLSIDDVSPQFNSNPRPTKFSEVYRFPISDSKVHKLITYVQDTRYDFERQIMLVTLLHDSRGFGYINQYGRVDTHGELGSFDFTVDGTDGVINFYPIKFAINNYNIFTLSYNINDLYTGIGSSSFGVVDVVTTSEQVSAGTTTTIVSMASTYTSAKVLVEVKTLDNQYEFDELTVIHDGTTVDLLEYGQLTNSSEDAVGSPGLGTYHPYISGGNVVIDFIPSVAVGASINTLRVAIGDTNSSGIGSFALDYSLIGSNIVSIASSVSPIQNSIAEYSTGYHAGYFIVQASDPDNNQHQISEVVVADNGTDVYVTEYGNLETVSGLGTIGAVKSGSTTQLMFTPNSGINVEVRTFYNYMVCGCEDFGSSSLEIDFTNAYIDSQYGDYSGTDVDIRKSFNLTYQDYQIFERYIDGSDATIIGSDPGSIIPNAITIPNHFFVTGEELVYSTPGAGTTENIGIATTSVTGVGTTDKLPSSVFAVKIDTNKIKLAETAEKALKVVPEVFDITTVGVGTSHTFTAKNQNAKALIAIDNYIQSPVVSTSQTSSTAQNVLVSDDIIYFTGISSFFGGDLIQIEDEIMKIRAVGFGSTNAVYVQRPWLGTTAVGYSTGALIRKVYGNYNIVNNTLNFVEAPYGNIPLSSTTNPPDSRDWAGITTSSTFQGRIFLRSGTPGGSSETYSKNYVFDDISDNFNGTENSFTLLEDGANITGISDENAIVLINDIMQVPGLVNDFTVEQQSGISSAVFVGESEFSASDINASSLPIGGVIVSVGSSAGYGYQPLVSAGATATVSIAGTISTITIGNTGSGYRADYNYEVLTSTSSTVSSGSTEIYIENDNSIFGYLNLLSAGSTCTIGVGTFIKPTNIISVGTTSVNIGIGSTSPYEIPAGTSIKVKIIDPQIGVVRVGVASSSVGITTVTHVGFATISNGSLLPTVTITNVASGYTNTNPPNVVIDDPLSYSNIPLIYQNPSSGIGTQAKIDIVVGQGSSIIDFSVTDTGYGFKEGQYLTVSVGGPTGIPTDPTALGSFENFTIIIKKTFTDKFAGWSVGQLQPIDDISDQFDGSRTDFQLKIGGNITSIKSSPGSNINVQDVLIILYNNILQVPGEGYEFPGGSTIIFSEPPKSGDKVSILFYKGSGDVDVVDVDILETVKDGDTLQMNHDSSVGQSRFLDEDKRIVTSVDSTDIVSTNPYFGPGNVDDINLERPVTWCKQTEDLILNGKRVSKNRDMYEGLIYPNTNILKTVGIGSTTIYVESVRPFFDYQNESNISLAFQKDILLVSQDEKVSAAATAIVSAGGTVTSVVLTSGGVGYTTNPVIIFETPVGLGTTQRARAESSITSGIVTSISITNPGIGYSESNPPVILIEPPSVLTERISSVENYYGDYGVIVGVATTSVVGVASTGLIFSFYVPTDSVMRNATIVGSAITVSGISTGDYFTVRNSNVGLSLTSFDSSGSIIGIGTSCIDNVYQAVSSTLTERNIAGIGTTTVNDVTVSVLNYNNYDFSSLGISTQTYFGDYSWGKIVCSGRTSTEEFTFYGQNGLLGISTSPYVRRNLPLKYRNYTT